MCNAMVMPETFEQFIDEYKFSDEKEYYTNGSELIQKFRVMQAWDYYKQKEYEHGCVKGYLNCINDHNYKPERLSIELTELESLKLERVSEVLNMGYPDVIKRAIDMIYIMVGNRNE